MRAAVSRLVSCVVCGPGTTYVVVFTDRSSSTAARRANSLCPDCFDRLQCIPGRPRHVHGRRSYVAADQASCTQVLLVAGRSVGRNASTAQHVTVVRGDLARFPSLASLGADRFSYAATTRMHGCTVRAQEQL